MKRASLLQSIMLVLLFTACAAPNEKGTISNTDSSNNSEIVFKMPQMPEYRHSDISGSDNGIYEIVGEGENFNILYSDYNTKQQVYLCNAPSCMHDSDSCTAFIPFNGAAVYPIAAGDKLVLEFIGDEYAENATEYNLPHLEICDANGANRKMLAKFAPSDRIYGAYACDGKKLYFKVTHTISQGENVVETSEIISVDLATGGKESLMKAGSNETLFLLGGANKLIVKKIYSEKKLEDFTGNDAMDKFIASQIHEIYELSTDGSHKKLLKKYNQYTIKDAMFDNWYFTLDCKDPLKPVLSKMNVVTGEETIVTTLSFAEKEYYNISALVDDQVIIYTNAATSDQKDYQTAININTGATTLISLEALNNGQMRPVLIEDEFDDQLLVIAKVEEVLKQTKGQDGNLRKFMGIVNHRALISKSDFFASLDNYEYIEVIK
ncbi:MAG: hypothetical protein RR978_02010 [Oscillospiraceae bacterium]